MYKILIVEDDEGIVEGLCTCLNAWGYQTEKVEDLTNVVTAFEKCAPHLVLLDIHLPFFNGFHWCNEIRKISNVPILFISSMGDNMSIVMAMNMGGDDFVIKPFDNTVLVSKIQALLRRTYHFTKEHDTLRFDDIVLNTEDNSVLYMDKKQPLTKNEYRILHTLLKQKGQIVRREHLMEQLWQTDAFVDDNTLTVNVTRLRKSLQAIGLTDLIKTKFKVGYIIE